MDKNAIKKFAVWARRALIERVSQKAMQYGIEEHSILPAGVDSVNGKVLTETEKAQRRALIAQIQAKDYKEVMEEVAYTWFNRFIALRFMEVNGYLPSHVRVFTDEENHFKPQIIDEALHLDLDGLDMDKVYGFKNANQTEELYKYLLIIQCNALNSVLPGMFQRISDYTELLLPDNLLREGSVLEQMVEKIPEEDWRDAVQIIGWLYQYYNAEKKDEVFTALKKNVKITKENIPAATQLFTPDWNSLGRLWVEGHPNDTLKADWKYYLEEAPQEPEVEAQLAAIRKEYAALTPDKIKCIDPCCGSGHILVYLFDVLMQIYESYGYTTREAVESIVQNNLYGLDIDDRAAQLAYFAVMMKARQYDRRFLSRGTQPHVYAIRESNGVDHYALEYFCNGDAKLKAAMDSILKDMKDAKEYGSILTVAPVDFVALYARFDEVIGDINLNKNAVLTQLLPLVQAAEALAQKYDVVVTNPPYMGSSGMGTKLAEYVKKNYPDSKSDLFAVFMESCGQMTKQDGYQAMITQHAWMFLSSFEKLRKKLMLKGTVNMAHLGARAFDEIGGEVVQTTSFVLRRSHLADYKGTYCRLIEPTSEQGKEDLFLSGENRYIAKQSNFSKIPGSSVAYWISNKIFNIFATSKMLYDVAKPRQGLATSDNDRFLKLWYEVNVCKIGFTIKGIDDPNKFDYKWFPCTKGGSFRRWYGNNEYIINWENDGFEIKEYSAKLYKNYTRTIKNIPFYFQRGLTWSTISSGLFALRYVPEGFIFETKGAMCYVEDKYLYNVLALYNTCVIQNFLAIVSPTLDYHEGPLGRTPIILNDDKIVRELAKKCVEYSMSDWDSFETSWDFKQQPLVKLRLAGAYAWGNGQPAARLASTYHAWKLECEGRFQKLKANEEELNRIFIDIYGLQDELPPEEEDKDVTVHYLADTKEDAPASLQGSSYLLTRRDVVVSLISYAVGCMFGRYSLDVEGLVYAGGNFDAKYCRWVGYFGDKVDESVDENGQLIGGGWAGSSQYKYDGVRKDGKWVAASFPPDTDNIIPICDDEYFEDDMVGRFVKFIETVYGSDTLEENLKFIADALGGKGRPREVIRSYFLNDFFADHCRTYQKRPIYWLFDSGKKNGFKALIYMHRYRPDTIARIRTDYVHEQQARYRTVMADLENRVASAATGERVKLNKALTRLKDQDAELRAYEEKIHHLADQMIAIDLDDGVKVNYAKFQDVLAKIK